MNTRPVDFTADDVLTALRAHPPRSAREIAAALCALRTRRSYDADRALVARHLRALRQAGQVRAAGTRDDDTPGRPPVLWELNPQVTLCPQVTP